jgi:hypothetical protein
MSIDKVKELEAELDKLPQETQVKIYPGKPFVLA